MTLRVLVVEDDADIRQGVVDALELAGYAVLQAATGAQGKQLSAESNADLVLLDLVLPHCDGLEILQLIRSIRPWLPVIILTARGDESDRVRGLKLGADDYVAKPFSVYELVARVEALFTPDRRKQREAYQVARR